MELLPIRVLIIELQKQGFEIEYDSDARGNRWMNVFRGDHLVTLFPLDPRDYRGRIEALAACRAAGFVWPD